ncbi:hypothetical protein ACF3MZ_06940 [Paenibacillaceae bacterium WGS1546]|uniref:hypothetical protein n=1 Tax=Cohnella sp. WGS1546 TaxID=3366810 RepID=UPI00372D00FF
MADMRNEVPAAALAKLAALLDREIRYVVGGSTGLALRGAALERPPRDLDLYVDETEIGLAHAKLREYALDGPEESTTDKYRSILSHYRIGGTTVELVGRFRVSAGQSVYATEVNEVLYPASDWLGPPGGEIPVVPLGHELLFNVLRDRPDRAALAGRLIADRPEQHMPLLQELVRRNRLSDETAAVVMRYAGAWGDER